MVPWSVPTRSRANTARSELHPCSVLMHLFMLNMEVKGAPPQALSSTASLDELALETATQQTVNCDTAIRVKQGCANGRPVALISRYNDRFGTYNLEWCMKILFNYTTRRVTECIPLKSEALWEFWVNGVIPISSLEQSLCWSLIHLNKNLGIPILANGELVAAGMRVDRTFAERHDKS
jgi:hypothetical protein